METIPEDEEMAKQASPGTSNATDSEHAGTVESTGSVTTESDDLNDNLSVISDSFSLASKTLRKHDLKKISAVIQKLKQENAALRDTLSKMKATDVAMLKNRLRGAQSDSLRLKQVNTEMKERVQLLEERIFALLAEQTRLRAESPTDRAKSRIAHAFAEKRKKQEGKADHEEQENLKDEGGEISLNKLLEERYAGRIKELEDEVKVWQKKHKHTEKLIKSYEVKMELLEDELRSKGVDVTAMIANIPSSSIKEHTEGTEVDDHKPSSAAVKFDTRSRTDKVRSAAIVDEEVRRRVQEARQADQKTIQELAAEVKRLVALLPRDKVDADEERANEHVDPSASEAGGSREGDRPAVMSETAGVGTAAPIANTPQVELLCFMLGGHIILRLNAAVANWL
eukprot:gene32961-39864_t